MTPLGRAHLAFFALASLAFVSGCIHPDPGPGPDPDPNPDPDVTHYPPSGKLALEVGTGGTAFEALGPGAQVPINFGPQGGEHIWLSARCQGVGSPATITYGIEDEQGGVVSAQQKTVAPSDKQDDGWRAVVGLTAFIDIDPASVEGKKVVFKAHVEDDYGSKLDAQGEALVQ